LKGLDIESVVEEEPRERSLSGIKWLQMNRELGLLIISISKFWRS